VRWRRPAAGRPKKRKKSANGSTAPNEERKRRKSMMMKPRRLAREWGKRGRMGQKKEENRGNRKEETIRGTHIICYPFPSFQRKRKRENAAVIMTVFSPLLLRTAAAIRGGKKKTGRTSSSLRCRSLSTQKESSVRCSRCFMFVLSKKKEKRKVTTNLITAALAPPVTLEKERGSLFVA